MSDDVIPKTPSAEAYKSQPVATLIADTDKPIDLFSSWLNQAREHELNDANAMSLATVDADGLPDVRMVLLKDVSARGFTFFTHATSAKGEQIEYGGAMAALCFHWKSLRRQVRIRGQVVRCEDSEADDYFASRARISQLGAWASDQSRPLEQRADLEARLSHFQALYGEDQPIPRPPQWIGYRVVPWHIEFWQDQPYRLHDRLKFSKTEAGWSTTRLNP